MNHSWMVCLASVLVVALLPTRVLGCRRSKPRKAQGQAAAVSASASAAQVRPPRAVSPPPSPTPMTVVTSDGVKLFGSLYGVDEGSAPAVILAHRMAGARGEWTPLLERLYPLRTPMNVLAIDLRGHGESTTRALVGKQNAKEAKKLDWNGLGAADYAAMGGDIQAAVKWLDGRPGGPARSLVLVGSDTGATAVTIAARAFGSRLKAVALVSPGASLRGVDIYAPYGSVLDLPNLVAAARLDTTSHDPSVALHEMAKGSELLLLDGRAHSAEFLGRENPELWDRLADWIEQRVGVGVVVPPM